MPDAMITVSGLAKSHAKSRILDGVDLAVVRGEVAVLIGQSGSGKSTLLRCINGLEPFENGEICVGSLKLRPANSSKSTSESLPALRRTIGMVFQQFHLFPHLNVMDNVTLAPRRALAWPREKAECEANRLLDRVGLAKKIASKPDQLSGGEQQRVAIARALAVQPQAILFDEPTSALDPCMAGEVLAVIADLARDGLTMLIVTHAMQFARQVAHNVHVISAGKIVESGSPAQLFSVPTHEATQSLVKELQLC
jgi:ABC-type polar amino acid transport system ATPase subunit